MLSRINDKFFIPETCSFRTRESEGLPSHNPYVNNPVLLDGVPGFFHKKNHYHLDGFRSAIILRIVAKIT